MALDDGRALPLASILLYDPGQGDPVVQDHGDGSYYDVLAQTYHWGTVELDANGLPLLEWVKDIGLCCRPYLVGQNTQLANFTTVGGAWEQVQPATGSPRWYRLSQYNTAANTAWSATSNFSLPYNPDFCFSLIIPDSPPDNNASLYPPYVQLQFGNGQWAIQYAKGGGAQLLAWNATWNGVLIPGWTVVMELPELQHVANQDNSEAFVWIRCLRGKLAISTDMGRTYALFAWGDPTIPVTVEQGPVAFSGQGNAALFGLHQLLYYEGDYTAPQWNTFTERTAPSPMIGAGPGPTTYTPPDGTSITFTDNSDPEDGIAGYIATLTPVEDTTTSPPGWNVWHTPELFAVWYEFPILLQPWSGGLTWSNPFDGLIRGLDIEKPLERGDSSCKFSVRLDAAVQFTFLYGRWPKIQALLGQTNESGTQSFLLAFTGYLRDPQTEWNEVNTLTFSVTADGPAVRFKRTKWSRTFRPPLSNWTVNQAIMYVFYTEGLGLYPNSENSSADSSSPYYAGHPFGDAVFLFAGQPESPFEWPPVGEDKWSTLQRLAGWAGLEMIPLDDGTFISLPKNFVQPYVSDIWEASPPENLLELVEKAHYGYDSGETVTAGIVGATDQWGRQIIFWVVDAVAEQVPTSGRFCPWREVWEEDVPGTANPLVIAARVQALATDKLLMKQEAMIHAPVALGVSRGDAAQVYNTPTGINNTDVLTVMTLHHHYEFDPSFETLYTEAGLRRIL